VVPPAALSPLGLERAARAVQRAWETGLEVGFTLHPESLGEVRVRVRWIEGALTARLEAASPAAREALASGLPALRSTLEEQGLPVGGLQVGAPPEGHAGWGGRRPAAPRRRSPVARIEAPPPPAVAAAGGGGRGRLDVRI